MRAVGGPFVCLPTPTITLAVSCCWADRAANCCGSHCIISATCKPVAVKWVVVCHTARHSGGADASGAVEQSMAQCSKRVQEWNEQCFVQQPTVAAHTVHRHQKHSFNPPCRSMTAAAAPLLLLLPPATCCCRRALRVLKMWLLARSCACHIASAAALPLADNSFARACVIKREKVFKLGVKY